MASPIINCTAFPDSGQTSALPPLWALPTGGPKAGLRTCTASPKEYMKACCSTDIGGEATTSMCEWTVCYTSASNAQLEACFHAYDAHVRGNDTVANEGAGWAFNCTDASASTIVTVTGTGPGAALQTMPHRSTASKRATVGWGVVLGALAVLAQ